MKISCDYIDLHERILDLARHQRHCLVEKDYLWTDFDRVLFAHNRKIIQQKPCEWLAITNLEGNSIVTNMYGLNGFPDHILAKVDGKAILDGGAFIGDTIPVFTNVFPNSTAYCFEPSNHNYNSLLNFIKRYVQDNKAIPVKYGLGDKSCTMQLNLSQDSVDSRASLVRDYQEEIENNTALTEEISITTIDEFVEQHQLNVGLIKLDIEGFEPAAIQGGLQTIKEQKPMLIVAIYHTPYEFYELKSYLEELDLGYKFAIRRSAFTNGLTELVLIAYQE